MQPIPILVQLFASIWEFLYQFRIPARNGSHFPNPHPLSVPMVTPPVHQDYRYLPLPGAANVKCALPACPYILSERGEFLEEFLSGSGCHLRVSPPLSGGNSSHWCQESPMASKLRSRRRAFPSSDLVARAELPPSHSVLLSMLRGYHGPVARSICSAVSVWT